MVSVKPIERVFQVVEQSWAPLDVEAVRKLANLNNWESTKALLLELALEGRIKARKTASHRWIFTAHWPFPPGEPRPNRYGV